MSSPSAEGTGAQGAGVPPRLAGLRDALPPAEPREAGSVDALFDLCIRQAAYQAALAERTTLVHPGLADFLR
jgi:hypothetical protein